MAPSRLDELRKRYEENPRRFFAPLANEYRKAGDLDQAISLCQTHLDEQPGNMNGHVVYGQALFDAGRYDEAQVTFTTALGLDPENLIALRHLGDISRLTNNAPQAIEWYNRVLEADPRNDEILAFIDELKASAPPPPQPAPPAPPREPTPVASPVVAEAPRTPAAPQGADR
ncbi:MAG TPA: tetratricopeptide repeat protein, partial [Gemmatimonadaceae bacterium]|nr:tetratricopeptide repeat protein [Gemmatimonadaceae bacterium]